MKWKEINQFGKVRALRISYLILFIVPIVAKSISYVGQENSVEFLDSQYTILLDLPFNWYLLYYSMILISIGNLIYLTRCPGLIKEFEDFSHFESSGRGEDYLFNILIKYLNVTTSTFEDFEGKLKELEFDYTIDNHVLVEFHNSKTRVLSKDVFWLTYDTLNQVRVRSRNWCVFTFGVGLVIFAILVIQKFWYVTELFIENWPPW